MKSFAPFVVCVAALITPALASAQNTARIECARNDGYVYLYSSTITLDIRSTLQCGEIVQLTGREASYFAVRSAKGDAGFVPMANITILKDRPGPTPAAEATTPNRERIAYDHKAAPAPQPVETVASTGFFLPNNTPIRLKLVKPLSSATSHVGDEVDLEVLDPVVVEGVTVIAKGAKVAAAVAVAEPTRRFGHSGRIAFKVTSIQMANNDQAPVRCYQEASGAPTTSSDSVVPLNSGKDATLPAETIFTGQVDGDLRLQRESFSSTTTQATPAATK
jgi:hypothetical protein